MKKLIVLVAFWAQVGMAQEVALPEADVFFLGEVHDNPGHHARQAELMLQIGPKAVVWEMLGDAQAKAVAPAEQAELAQVLNWQDSGWPDFNMYYPIFAASFDARHYGAAVPRDVARGMMGKTAADVFGAEAARFGVEAPLPEQMQEVREAMQMAAHCNAMPAEMMGFMVEFQRLRDARLAQEALAALQDTGGPVAVITGNGHARKDWGAPAALLQADPEVRIFALGQAEEGGAEPEGGFDLIVSSPPAKREDPCLAFR